MIVYTMHHTGCGVVEVRQHKLRQEQLTLEGLQHLPLALEEHLPLCLVHSQVTPSLSRARVLLHVLLGSHVLGHVLVDVCAQDVWAQDVCAQRPSRLDVAATLHNAALSDTVLIFMRHSHPFFVSIQT
jgi:hypothetical protein